MGWEENEDWREPEIDYAAEVEADYQDRLGIQKSLLRIRLEREGRSVSEPLLELMAARILAGKMSYEEV